MGDPPNALRDINSTDTSIIFNIQNNISNPFTGLFPVLSFNQSFQTADPIQQAVRDHATEINYSIEAILEIAIAGYLDNEAIGCTDGKPDRGR
jgi:hypothetical protein